MASTERISLLLNKDEMNLLCRMAETDFRHPREQLRFLLRQEAQQRGWVTGSSDSGKDEESSENTFYPNKVKHP